jgi:cyclophilin family peptidyl-prolyl cis-trans isomerase/methionine-rich copper-binding protein CopC
MTTPTVTITDNLLGTANRATGNVAYTLNFSESVSGLAADDFTVTNGTVASVTGGGSSWTVNITPTLGVASSTIGLTLKAGAVSDTLGNLNAIASNTSQIIDTVSPVAPKLVTSTAFNYLINPQITLQSSLGTVVLELYPEQAPITVANMLAYVDSAFYDNTLFHRVIDDFMVQGGGLTSGLVAKQPTYGAITLESNNGLSNVRGTIAMARTSVADSATTQFFINQADNTFLNYSSAASPGYAVFGQVVTGLTVIDSIAQVATATVGPYSNVPVTEVGIASIRQTVAGSIVSNANTLQVSGLEAGAQWSYSLDGGSTWNAGSGSSFALPLGDYAANSIQVRQTDSAGNASAGNGKLTSEWLITDTDVTAPTVSITDGLLGTANRASGNVAYTLNFSESVSGLAADDFTVSNGTVASVTGSGSSWTVNITPTLGVANGTIGLTLKAGAVSDAAGNPNAIASNTSQTIDTVAPIAPKLVTSTAFNYLINPQITLQSSLGTVVLELYPEQAPITVANMLAYVDAAFYDNTLFHRVIDDFMVQGGGFNTGLAYKTPTYGAITLESNNGLSNVRGTIAMARTNLADSATTQFFINQADNTFLNYSSTASPGYAVFGQVVSGLTVIDNIAQVATATVGSFTDVPVTDVVITSIRQTQAGSGITRTNTLQISGVEAGAQWSYSLDGGVNWSNGVGVNLAVPDGSYAANAIQVRQTDTAGNTSVGTGKLTSAWVVDTHAPSVISFSPADEAVAVALGSNIIITFNEAIARGTGTILLKDAAGGIVESFDAASARLRISGTTLTIDPSLDLTYSPRYTVELAAGTVVDLAGNGYAGTSSYNFATNSPPTGSVAIDVSATQAQTLTANTNALTDADGLGLIHYQWQANGSPIDGATTGSFVWGEAEAGKTLTLFVSYSDSHGIAETVLSTAFQLGTTGNDTLTSSTAHNRLAAGPGNDTYHVQARTNTLIELPNEGIDTVHAPLSWALGANLENLTLSGSGNYSATGNAVANQLTGNAGNNLLNGGSAADTLIGGLGNDTYVVDNASDSVVETSSLTGEIDNVRTFVHWTLGDNLENLTLLGTKNLSGTGNGLNNALNGNGGNNALSGGDGNDHLNGASGNDTLTGGNGSDTFAFTTPLNASRNVDTVTDFVSGVDTLQLAPAIFRALGFTGTPSTDAFFHAGNTAHDADDRVLYDQTNGALYYDADGTGELAAVQFAVLGSMPTVLYTDFYVA